MRHTTRSAPTIALCFLTAMLALACDDEGGDREPDADIPSTTDVATTTGDTQTTDLDGTSSATDTSGDDLGTAADADDVLDDADVGTDIGSPDADAEPEDTDAATDAAMPPGTIPVIAGVGWQGLTMVSIDEGLTWCQTDIMDDGHDDLYRGGTWADGLFVGAHAGLNNRGSIRVSTDGHAWESRHATNREPDLTENPMRQWYGGVAYGNGVWLAAGGCGKLARSTDGTATWTDLGRFSDTCLHIRSMVFHGGQFVFGADNDNWYASPDGDELTLLQEGAGSRVTVVDGALTGPIEGRTWSQGRGICLAGGGSPNFRIFRSESPGCADPQEVADTPANVTTFLFGVADESRYTRVALGGSLADCLGVE